MRIPALVLAATLAGCAALRPAPPPEALSGRLAVRVDANAGQPASSMSASFELRGTPQAGELELTSPLGQTMARARWAPGNAELMTSDGVRTFADLDALALEGLGQPVPLAALFDWLRGRPWPGAPSEPTVEGFEQVGWRVDLAGAAEGTIVATRVTPPTVVVRARMDPPR